MIADLKSINPIEDIPFVEIMRNADPRPALFDDLVLGMDVVIWRMRPCITASTSQYSPKNIDHLGRPPL